jgi:spore coat polysaccharide biosynthesis predicted glycosyltransferase SpsG
MPHATVRIAGGFTPPAGRRVLDGVEWLGPQPSLVPLLASASAAVVAGGLTLYEAAALGVPVVAIPVVPAQRPTVRAFGQAGLALTGTSAASVSASLVRLLTRPRVGRSMTRKGPRVVDGLGAHRVAGALEALMRRAAR